MPPPAKIRKVDSENRQFLNDWKLQFFFILRESDKIPLCLICQDTVALCKSGNLKRHYDTKHKSGFELKFPLESNERKAEFERLSLARTSLQKSLIAAIRAPDYVTEASFRVCYLLVKHKKPFSDAELMKECFLSASEVLFNSMQNKDKIIHEIKKMPLNRMTCARRCQVMGTDIYNQLK